MLLGSRGGVIFTVIVWYPAVRAIVGAFVYLNGLEVIVSESSLSIVFPVSELYTLEWILKLYSELGVRPLIVKGEVAFVLDLIQSLSALSLYSTSYCTG